MEFKILEIRDKMTFISALAIEMNYSPGDDIGAYYIHERCGYAFDKWRPTILLTALAGMQPAYADPYDWKDRTYAVAHIYITENWHTLKTGDVIDVEYILGETTKIKTSERLDKD